MRLEGLIIPISFDRKLLDAGMKGVEDALKDFGATASQLAAIGAIGGVGVAYVDFLKSTIEPAAEAETAQVRLTAALHATGRAAEIEGVPMADIATQMMKLSTFDDEAIKGAFQTLAQFPSIPTDAFANLTQAAMDLSAATGTDLQGNVESLGRALESGVIPRSWGFSAALKAQFKAQVDAGDSAGALILMMDQLNLRYGGQAAAEVSTYAGQVKQLSNNWSEFKEGIGGQFIPALAGLLGWVNANFIAITQLAEGIYALLNPLGALAGYIGKITGSALGSSGVSGPKGKGAGGGAISVSTSGGGSSNRNKAAGGWGSGLTWVGERGPELVNLPTGSYVHSNSESMGMGGGFNMDEFVIKLSAELAKVVNT